MTSFKEDNATLSSDSLTNLTVNVTGVNKTKQRSQNECDSDILVMRHGERVDSTYNYWIKECFTKDGKYCRNDLNMPLTVPKRENIPKSYEADSPITNVGILQGRLTGEALAAAGITIKHAYCSSSLRCVQTCQSVLTGLGIQDKLAIRVEPALFEWMKWFQGRPLKFMTVDELIAAGYNVDKTYKPMISREDIIQKHSKENCNQYYNRHHKAVMKILEDEEEGEGYILIVAHASSLETCSRQLIGLKPRTEEDLNRIMKDIFYCSAVHLQEQDSEWKLKESPIHCISNSQNQRFDYKILCNL